LKAEALPPAARLLANGKSRTEWIGPTATGEVGMTMELPAGRAGLWGTGLTDLGSLWGPALSPYGAGGSSILWGESLANQGVWDDSILWGESWSGADLSSTVLIGDPDALSYGPLSFMRP